MGSAQCLLFHPMLTHPDAASPLYSSDEYLALMLTCGCFGGCGGGHPFLDVSCGAQVFCALHCQPCTADEGLQAGGEYRG